MLKKTITYTNPFTEESITEDAWFNLNKAEITKMAMVEGEGADDYLRGIIAANNVKEVLVQFEKLVAASYGKREGNEFVKSPEISQKFLSSEAYSELFLELISVDGAMEEFGNGLMPKDIGKFVEELEAKKAKGIKSPTPEDDRPAWIKENREPTQKELTSMTKEQLVEVMARKQGQQA